MGQTNDDDAEIEPDFDDDELAALALGRALEQLKACSHNSATASKEQRLIYCIHELENVIAYFDYFVFRGSDELVEGSVS